MKTNGGRKDPHIFVSSKLIFVCLLLISMRSSAGFHQEESFLARIRPSKINTEARTVYNETKVENFEDFVARYLHGLFWPKNSSMLAGLSLFVWGHRWKQSNQRNSEEAIKDLYHRIFEIIFKSPFKVAHKV